MQQDSKKGGSQELSLSLLKAEIPLGNPSRCISQENGTVLDFSRCPGWKCDLGVLLAC